MTPKGEDIYNQLEKVGQCEGPLGTLDSLVTLYPNLGTTSLKTKAKWAMSRQMVVMVAMTKFFTRRRVFTENAW